MDSVPEDMERRRIADLRKFVLACPTDPMVPKAMLQIKEFDASLGTVQTNSNLHSAIAGEKKGMAADTQQRGKGPWWKPDNEQPKCKRRLEPYTKGAVVNKWCTVSTLELLAEMKRFQEDLKASKNPATNCSPRHMWEAIAEKLPNRCQIEKLRYARSCNVHFVNMSRAYNRISKRKNIEPQVLESLESYLKEYSSSRLRSGVAGSEAKASSRPPRKNASQAGKINCSDGAPDSSKKTAGGASDADGTKSDSDLQFFDAEDDVDDSSSEDDIAHVETNDQPQRAGEGPEEKHGQPRRVAEAQEGRNGQPERATEAHEGRNGQPQRVAAEAHELTNDQPEEEEMNYSMKFNRWDKVTSLELLDAMQKFEENKKLTGDKGLDRWERIAAQLPNRCNVEPARYTRSCKAHYSELMRTYRREKGNKCDTDRWKSKPMEDEVRAKLEDWFRRFAKRKTSWIQMPSAPQDNQGTPPNGEVQSVPVKTTSEALRIKETTTNRKNLVNKAPRQQVTPSATHDESSWDDSVNDDSGMEGPEVRSKSRRRKLKRKHGKIIIEGKTADRTRVQDMGKAGGSNCKAFITADNSGAEKSNVTRKDGQNSLGAGEIGVVNLDDEGSWDDSLHEELHSRTKKKRLQGPVLRSSKASKHTIKKSAGNKSKALDRGNMFSFAPGELRTSNNAERPAMCDSLTATAKENGMMGSTTTFKGDDQTCHAGARQEMTQEKLSTTADDQAGAEQVMTMEKREEGKESASSCSQSMQIDADKRKKDDEGDEIRKLDTQIYSQPLVTFGKKLWSQALRMFV